MIIWWITEEFAFSNPPSTANKKKRKKKKSQQMDLFEDALNISSLRDNLPAINPSPNDHNDLPKNKSKLNSPSSSSVVNTVAARKIVAYVFIITKVF